MRLPTAAHAALIFCGLNLATGGCRPDETSTPRVTNGAAESGFPFVVRIVMDGKGSCTGSFVSDSLLLTAAHCVDRAQSVVYGTAEAKRESIFIHAQWPASGESCGLPREPKNDVALVRFPAGTYTGALARLALRSPEVGETFKIVGYGNDLIEPFERFCRLTTAASGTCAIQRGDRVQGVEYKYASVFQFTAAPETPSPGVCPVACDQKTMKQALAADGQAFDAFVAAECGGNFRDRSYKETGSGVKRSGTNVVAESGDGTVRFFGALGGEASGLDSASGAGDSGGPLFVKVAGAWRIGAVTHGGSLAEVEGTAKKRSIYVDLDAPHNRAWLTETVAAHGLSFPDLQ